MSGLAALVVGALGLVTSAGRATPSRQTRGGAVLTINLRHPTADTFSPQLFGVGIDYPAGTYKSPSDTQCLPLPNVGTAVSLVRIGAVKADDYDWRADTLYDPHPPHRREPASYGCPNPRLPSVLRALDRVRQLRATAVVVLNGEIDDPQAAAGLVRLVARRYGLEFARRVYWEVGNAPATWQYFGVSLTARDRPGVPPTCSPDQYAALVTSYAAALRAALGNVDPLLVADEWITNATDQSWTGPVTAVDASYYPFNSNAPGSSTAQGGKTPSPADVAQSIAPGGARGNVDTVLDERFAGLRANLAQYNEGSATGLFVGSWNVDANTQADNPLYNSPAQQVFVARLLLHLARDRVSMAAWAQPLYGFPPAPFVAGQPTLGFRVFAALRHMAGARLLSMTGATGLDGLAVRLPGARIAGGRVTGGRVTGDRVIVALANPATRGAATLRLRLAGATAASAAAQTFSPAAPNGVSTRLTVIFGAARLVVPALGVTIVTLVASGQ